MPLLIKIIMYLLLTFLSIQVTILRLFMCIFNLGLGSPDRSFYFVFLYDLPDILSVFFCAYFIHFFLMRCISNVRLYTKKRDVV